MSGSMGWSWFHRVEWKQWLKKACYMACIVTSLHASLSTGLAPISWVVLSLNSWCCVLLLKGGCFKFFMDVLVYQTSTAHGGGIVLNLSWFGGVSRSGDSKQVSIAIALQGRVCMLVTIEGC